MSDAEVLFRLDAWGHAAEPAAAGEAAARAIRTCIHATGIGLTTDAEWERDPGRARVRFGALSLSYVEGLDGVSIALRPAEGPAPFSQLLRFLRAVAVELAQEGFPWVGLGVIVGARPLSFPGPVPPLVEQMALTVAPLEKVMPCYRGEQIFSGALGELLAGRDGGDRVLLAPELDSADLDALTEDVTEHRLTLVRAARPGALEP